MTFPPPPYLQSHVKRLVEVRFFVIRSCKDITIKVLIADANAKNVIPQKKKKEKREGDFKGGVFK